jgi:isopentenyl-diphosphate delta-isomerase
MRVHQKDAPLHRAFSIFVFNSQGKLLLQQRAQGKYHFAGLWTNTCCSHPTKGKTLEEAAHRRLQMEFGFDTELTEMLSFIYRAYDPISGLTEHEFDHVLVGRFDGEPMPNSEEIDSWKWVDLADVKRELERNPALYTPWFKIAMERMTEAPTHNELLAHAVKGEQRCSKSPAHVP